MHGCFGASMRLVILDSAGRSESGFMDVLVVAMAMNAGATPIHSLRALDYVGKSLVSLQRIGGELGEIGNGSWWVRPGDYSNRNSMKVLRKWDDGFGLPQASKSFL